MPDKHSSDLKMVKIPLESCSIAQCSNGCAQSLYRTVRIHTEHLVESNPQALPASTDLLLVGQELPQA